MYKIGEYLDEFETLTPTIASLDNEDWWNAVKTQLNDLIWLYYYDRELIGGTRFQSDNDTNNYNNIMRTFEIYLKQNNRRFNRVFNAFVADFNPLWNVDGVTGTISESQKTGNDELKKTGTETGAKTGTDTNVKSGNETHAGSGSDTDTTQYLSKMGKNGYREVEQLGDEFTEKQNTPNDSVTWYDTEKETTRFNNRKEKESFTNYADEHTGKDIVTKQRGTTETDTYNNVTDELTHNTTDTTTFNTSDKTIYNTDDKFVEMVIRQGNIGVTRSDELITHAIELFNSVLYDFYKMVARELVNLVTYRVY